MHIAALQKKLDALAVENAALKQGDKYFMHGPDCGFEIYDSQDSAVKAANEMIDDYREDAADGWCDEVDQVCFGVILSYACQVDVQAPSEDNAFLGSVDYLMSAPETPETDAYLNSVRADAIEEFWNKSLIDTALCLAGIGTFDKANDRREAEGIVHSEIKERVGEYASQLRATGAEKDGE